METHSRMQKAKAALLLLLTLLLGGCSLEYGDGLLSLPKLPGEYLLLQREIDAILSTGAVYATAETGANRQAVQLIDMDGDGEDEAIAFFRMPGGDFLVCAYQRAPEGYVEIGRAEGFGSTIHAVHYPRISAEGELALALSWGLEDVGSYGMTVFGFTGGGLQSMMDIQYSSLLVRDFNGDSLDELCFAVRDAVTGRFSLRTYGHSRGAFRLQSEAPLCTEVRSVSRMTPGTTRGGRTAVFVDSVSTGSGYVTDVIALTEGGAVNETIDLVSDSGLKTWRLGSVSSMDIDGDGIIDVPTVADPPEGASQAGEDLQAGDGRFKLCWRDFAQGEEPIVAATTYHSISEEWYLLWPESWGSSVKARRSSASGVSRTEFVAADDTLPEAEWGMSLLEVFVYTGDNRVVYAVADGVKILRQTERCIYGYLLPESAPPAYALTAEQAEQLIKLVEKEWTAGGYMQ